MSNLNAAELRKLATDPKILKRIHLTIEDLLVEFRDSGIGLIGPANGLIIKEKDGSSSDVIRLDTRGAVRLTLKTLADILDEKE